MKITDLTPAQIELVNYFAQEDAAYLSDRFRMILELAVVFSSDLSEDERAGMYPLFRLLNILVKLEREK